MVEIETLGVVSAEQGRSAGLEGLHPGQGVAVGVMAAASTVGVALGAGGIALGAGGIFISAGNWPYLVAFPLIVVASLLESLRIRGLRVRWGE